MNFVFVLFVFLFSLPDNDQVKEARRMYAKAIVKSDAADNMLATLSALPEKNALVTGYLAASQALIAKHAVNPYTKVKMLKQSEETFTQAVKADPGNVEIRFLRFTIQHYVPEWLGFSKNLEEDKKVILANLPAQKINLESRELDTIVRFLLECGRCSTNEVSQLKTFQVQK